MSAPKKRSTPGTETILRDARMAFERSEAPFYEGMQMLKAAQKDFDLCAKNKNLYSHALRAVRHIAKQPCEAGCAYHMDSQRPDQYADIRLCWPCFARNALREGGDNQ